MDKTIPTLEVNLFGEFFGEELCNTAGERAKNRDGEKMDLGFDFK